MPDERVLLVDDEPGVRATLSEVLALQGFHVTTASTVSEGLDAMSKSRFDALVSDLNVGEPGDGFTLVSAMRRTQPHAITLIITGFPAFDSALEAIRNQVDGYLIKPTKVAELVQLLRTRLDRDHLKHQPLHRQRVSEVVRENMANAVDEWRQVMRSFSRPPWSTLTGDELENHLSALIEELCWRVDNPREQIRQNSLDSAREHGRLRKAQGFTIPEIMCESRELRRVLLNLVHANLLVLNLSYIFTDLAVMSVTIDDLAQTSVSAYLAT